MRKPRFLKKVMAVASKYGVSRIRHRRLRKRLFNKKMIAEGARLVFSNETRAANVASWRPHARTMEILTAVVQFDEYRISKLDGSLVLLLDIADGNHFPALSAGVWLSKSLRWPAGFFTVRGSDKAGGRKLFRELQVISRK
jgi:hypothetical protein